MTGRTDLGFRRPACALRWRRAGAASCLALSALLISPGRVDAAAGPAVAGRPAAGRSEAGRPAAGYVAPVRPLTVLRPFIAPLTRFGPGHRGVDLAVADAGTVQAAGAGVVSFAGSVAGRGVVVVLHPDGVRTEYEPLAVAVHTGQTVTSSTVLGHVAGQHAGCTRCLHWGARRGDAYFDPLTLLHPLGPVRLVPWTDA